jgi:energy-coupling factor transporter ATP-binding protein EcfA2
VFLKRLLKFDRGWCGNHQVPASLLLEVSGDGEGAATLAWHRLLLSLFLTLELMGFYLVTFGLDSARSVWFFVSGVVLKIGADTVSCLLQNRSGTLISMELHEWLQRMGTQAPEVRALLADGGCSEAEIGSLETLPAAVYQTEINSYQRSKIINMGAPIACGLALAVNGDLITASVVVVLGLASFPIGERFFRENALRNESELRLGRAARLVNYLRRVYREHLWLTVRVNFLSQLPLLLFAIRLMWNGAGQLLSSFFALTQGLMGLTGTLAYQKARATAVRTTTTTSRLVQALSSPYLIATPRRWSEHCKPTGAVEAPGPNGVLLQNYSPTLPQKIDAAPLTCFIPSGAVCLLRAPSGRGKSTLLAALTHLIEHSGDLAFITDGQPTNAHQLSREELATRLFLFREDGVEATARLVDLFRNIAQVELRQFLQHLKQRHDPVLVDLAWNAPDNLLEKEIGSLEAGKRSALPVSMLGDLIELRKMRAHHLQTSLEKAGGNLSTARIQPERAFSTMSSGERRRFTSLLALESCRSIPAIRLVILDEPLAHLDADNIQCQLDVISKIQTLSNPPSLLIISHHHIEELKTGLKNIQEVAI